MSYSSFTLEDLAEKFKLRFKSVKLFDTSKSVIPSAWLQESLEISQDTLVRSKKARSEHYVLPILMEMKKKNRDFMTYYSGETLNADKSLGLTGECDYILAKKSDSPIVQSPLLVMVEAEKNDFDLGIPQCIAQMIGAKIYNQRHGEKIEEIYGCVTTGTEWRFMKLRGEYEVLSDTESYFIKELETILGIFQQIIDFYRNEIGEG
ncbi:MAG: hypothetical protein MUE81_05295 [Thermoflexibacter sp.]|jgi:hypothetical protein|nr:hypothetical protein [Thermoflexibacter sp.]